MNDCDHGCAKCLCLICYVLLEFEYVCAWFSLNTNLCVYGHSFVSGDFGKIIVKGVNLILYAHIIIRPWIIKWVCVYLIIVSRIVEI